MKVCVKYRDKACYVNTYGHRNLDMQLCEQSLTGQMFTEFQHHVACTVLRKQMKFLHSYNSHSHEKEDNKHI